jgi:hypothetical protein
VAPDEKHSGKVEKPPPWAVKGTMEEIKEEIRVEAE